MLIPMTATVFLNGAYLPAERATISPFDRGFIFADGVYEVVRYYGGKPFTMADHLDRLANSMSALRLALPADHPAFDDVSEQLVNRNDSADCYVYWQVTRGAAPRDHRFPAGELPATTFAFAKPMPPLVREGPPASMTAITHPETRWARCSIKSIALLPNVLARQAAEDAGCEEAIFVRDDGTVTEGTARSIFAVIDGHLRTHPLDGSILPSITRQVALDLAGEIGMSVDEAAFARDDMLQADEVFLVGTTTEVRPVLAIDGQSIGSGEPGSVTVRLAEAMRQRIIADCGL